MSCCVKWTIFTIIFIILIIIEIISGWVYINSQITLIENNTNDVISQIINQTSISLTYNLNELQYNMERTSEVMTYLGHNVTPDMYINLMQFEIYSRNKSVFFLWIPLIPNDEMDIHIEYMRENWNESYAITEIVNNQLIPSPINNSYYAPLDGLVPLNETYYPLIGFDLFSINETEYFINRANEFNGSFSVSDKAIPFNGNNSYGITITKTSCKNNECNMNEIIGYNIALVNIIDFVKLSLPILINISDIRIEMYNVLSNDTEQLLFADEIDDNFINNVNEIIFPYYGKTWKIDIYFSDDYINQITSNINITILILILSLFIIDIIIIIIAWTIIILKSRKNAMESKYNIANHMLGYVNHEIRNPLNAIIGLIDISLMELVELFAEYNIRDLKSTAILSNLDTSNKSCLLLRYIVNDILDVRKLEENKLVFELEDFELSDLIKDISKIISTKLKEKPHIIFNIKYENCLITSDRNRLIQLCLNLLTNAIKYTHEGSIDLIIEEYDLLYLKFKVIDTGIGISEEKKLRIFKPFEQVQDNNNSRYGGIGLGLYLCKLIISNIDGEIGFESEAGKGSIFWFKIKKIENIEKIIKIGRKQSV